MIPTEVFYCSDSALGLQQVDDGAIHFIMTSPPFYGVRNYHVDGQIGQEESITAYLASLERVFRECYRVLHKTGSLWVNMGDSYASGKGRSGSPGPDGDQRYKAGDTLQRDYTHFGGPGVLKRLDDTAMLRKEGIKAKSLIGMPWRVAFMLMDIGFILRAEIIWAKPNPTPESVQDRTTRAHEQVFWFTKRGKYFCDPTALREKSVSDHGQGGAGYQRPERVTYQNKDGSPRGSTDPWIMTETRNMRDVWTIAPEPSKIKHYAMFPRALVVRPMLATCPEHVCAKCGAPYVPVIEKKFRKQPDVSGARAGHRGKRADESHWGDTPRGIIDKRVIDMRPTCKHNAGTLPGIALDPFMGTGTVALVARAFKRRWIGFELNEKTVAQAKRRCRKPFDPFEFEEEDGPPPPKIVSPGIVQQPLWMGTNA
jgi:DNA modification methylase